MEAERAYASLSRYFSPNLAQRLVGDLDAIDLGGQRRAIATLFTDIADFTTLVDALEPGVLGHVALGVTLHQSVGANAANCCQRSNSRSAM